MDRAEFRRVAATTIMTIIPRKAWTQKHTKRRRKSLDMDNQGDMEDKLYSIADDLGKIRVTMSEQ